MATDLDRALNSARRSLHEAIQDLSQVVADEDFEREYKSGFVARSVEALNQLLKARANLSNHYREDV